ncbi:hypothetical protein HID58_083992 [Brassica napus]|uniref:Uncharacterized protein n=1 Tax=Brassica napus TaxID=3708 RepID=A0ABQ7XKW8_BRANA|nr:hypothetical protein HID58_083992 [Brassica napus]
MKEIKEEEERARREQTLKSVLVTPSRDFVITRDGNKVPVSELDRNWGLIFYLIITDGTMRSNQLGVCLLSYEMNRGYFADMKEFKEHGGIIGVSVFPSMLPGCTWRGEVVYPTCNADGEPRFYKENQMMKCSACYGRGLNALKDGSDSM